MTDSLRFTIDFDDAGDGWTVAPVREVPGAISQGKTREEARDNVIDALRLSWVTGTRFARAQE